MPRLLKMNSKGHMQIKILIKLNFEKKIIETEEANSSLSLEEAIVRWVGLDEIKQKFNASDIM